MTFKYALATLAMMLTQGTLADASGNAERGAQLYRQKCAACHTVENNSTGPRHKGVFGRRAGTVSDYSYSLALEDQDFEWNEKTLDAWLTDPSAVVPGNLMGMSVSSAQDRQDLIAYLKSL